jgi:hypothetical protein
MFKLFSSFFGISIALFSLIGGTALAQDKKTTVQDYTVGKSTQKVTPREMKATVRPDGKTSIVTGQQRDASGKITGPHSHSIVNQGKVENSLTASGRPVAGSVPRGGAVGGSSGSTAPPQGGGGGKDKAK